MAQISLELQLRTASSPTPEPALRARHRRFFESKKRKESRNIEESGHQKHKLNRHGTFDTRDSTDYGGASKARVPRPPPPAATPTLAATTSSPVGLLGSFEVPTIVGNFNLSIYTNNFVANTYAAPQPTPFPTSSDTPNVSGVPTNIEGFGGPSINGFIRQGPPGSTISGGTITGVILGVVGLIIAAVIAIIFMRKRRLRRLGYPRGALPPMSQASSGKPPSAFSRARKRAESILWGSQTTVGNRTEASFPASTVPSVKGPAAKHNKDGLNMLTPPLRYPDPTRNPTPNIHRHMSSGSTERDRIRRPTSIRSPGPNMQSRSWYDAT
ncbi:hypothetical protein HYFRA_00002045 [Hymenoscyphus fraxineus]|uniref:Uncharacterized protein n=1 Tax=Hymenoscyphus fraxineus TaxID=746836 RepID=A0A9N9KL07_9HELO|nr:hypothetical protein HYFRA_00002045 [Hymenoscyphus fraxineus]